MRAPVLARKRGGDWVKPWSMRILREGGVVVGGVVVGGGGGGGGGMVWSVWWDGGRWGEGGWG